MRNLQDAARRAKVELLPVDVDTVAEIESGFAQMARERIKAVVVLGDPMVFFHRRQIADLALKHGIASAYPARQHSEDGGLMSYGVNIAVCHVPPDLAHPRSETILATFSPET